MISPHVRPRSAFGSQALPHYRLLPFRFVRWQDGSVLVTNECGEFLFVPPDAFEALAQHHLPAEHPWRHELKARHFLLDSDGRAALELLATKIRTKRSFLTGFTRLHIFVVTLRCNSTCVYCQASRVSEDRVQYDMSLDTASLATDWCFRVPAREIKIEFQGGEPTLNWPVVTHVVNSARRRAATEGRHVEFVLATNLTAISDDALAFCRDNQVCLSTSLDGPCDLHNANRPRPVSDGYALLRTNLERARAFLGHDGVSALMTATPASLHRPQEIVDTYVALGFDSVFLRSLSPYGFASKVGLVEAYSPLEFVEFYRNVLDYIIHLNRKGTRFVETFTQVLLRKILTPFPVGYVDLQSPAGAALGALAYNYDGDVYASDEGRMLAAMGDRSFRLGSLATDNYADVLAGPRVRALVENSCLETLPGCSECAFLPYCGADPVRHWATQVDIVGHRPTSDVCKKHKGIFEYLFSLIRQEDPFVMKLFLEWANR